MKLTRHLLTQNDCYKAGRSIRPAGVMVHSTGVAQPDVDIFLRNWDKPGVAKCVHAFVTRDGVVQTLPWTMRGWHAGGKANDTHIGFEILEPAGHKYNGGAMIGYDAGKNAGYFAVVWQNAVELAAHLCEMHGLTEKDVICHSEGHKKGIASNHSDVMHWFPKHGKTMDDFRASVGIILRVEADSVYEESKVNVFGVAVPSIYKDGKNYVELRPMVEAIKKGVELSVDWSPETGATVGVVKK